ALGTDVREVGVGQHVHHTPRVVGVVPGELAPDRLAHLAARTVAPDHVLGTHRPLCTLALARTGAQGDGDRVVPVVGDLEVDELVTVVRYQPPGRMVCGLGEVV